MMTANVLIILMEERYGMYASPQWGTVLAANLPWLVLPAAVLARMAWRPHPFTERLGGSGEDRGGSPPSGLNSP